MKGGAVAVGKGGSVGFEVPVICPRGCGGLTMLLRNHRKGLGQRPSSALTTPSVPSYLNVLRLSISQALFPNIPLLDHPNDCITL